MWTLGDGCLFGVGSSAVINVLTLMGTLMMGEADLYL